MRTSRWPRHQRGAILWGGLWVLGMGLGLALGLGRPGGPTLCLFRRVTGLPCPTCGGTRAADRLVHGDVAGAFALNPLVVAALLATVAILTLWFVFGRKLEVPLGGRGRRGAWIAIVLLVLANWAWVLLRTG